ncbi:MAG TPA: autotransporter-associated beta strand repeat-containing protein [Verrucomicrobiae bacterium]|nr:autotransporter-associated beta strand repeat-containing protein [Verrucomicrobiae bacterium]
MNTSYKAHPDRTPRSHKRYLLVSITLALTSLLASVQFANAAPITFTNAAGGNWSVGANWNPAGPPASSSDVVFGDGAGNSTTTEDILSATINSMTYNQDNGSQQTTIIPSGQTLTIASGVAAGSAELNVGSTSASTTSTTLVPAAIQGLSSTLSLTGSGDIWVSQGNSTAGGHLATLDLSQLGTLNANIGRLLVGVNVSGINRPAGVLFLAQTNNLTLSGGSPEVEVAEATSNGNIGQANTVLSFGQQNRVFANVMRLGGDKCMATINFAAAHSGAPSLLMRAADGVSPCSVIDFGYNAGNGGTGTAESLTADFSAGTVDISASVVHIPQGQPGSGSGPATSTVTLGAGNFAVPDLEIGYGNATAANSGGTTGTLNVNNNGLFSTGAVVTCSTVLNLARTNTASTTIAPVTGTLSINGGTVIANAITSGGGTSGIAINTGTLLVSNTVGSLSRPIGTLGANGATLDVPLSFTGGAITVSNLITGGGNVVNITAIPGIASYPVTFTLIQYQGTEGGSGPGTFTLNSLPAATPNYVGTIVDTGNGVVQIQLTSGPTAVLSTTWTGTTDNNWDYVTPNWLYQGVAADFVDGRATIFDDSSTQTNILLDASPLSPSSITVTNNVRQYTFGGTGFLSSGTLVKSGSSRLTLDNGGNNNLPTIVINNGTLQLGAGDANGGLASVNITNNGALVVDHTDNVTLSGAIAGNGTLTQGGSGTLILSGANTYNGATSVTNGTLEIDQTSAGTGPVNTSAGTVLSGIGIVNGLVTVQGTLSPGTASGGQGTFQAGGGLTLSAGGTGNFGLNAAFPTLGDSVAVNGNLVVNNNAINISFNGVPSDGSYPLFTYTGTLSGAFNPTVTGTHFTAAVDTNSFGSVNLDVSGSGYALEWASTSSGEWDNVSSNWNNLGNSTQSSFLSGDSVLFDDTNGVVTTIDIPSGTTVYPLSITDTATNNNFTISGAGHISGSSGIVMSGLGTLAIATANSFTGPVDIQAGVLQTQNGAALGSASSVTVESNATLDVDGQNLGSAIITASGPGVGGGGAIVNNGANDTQALRQLVLVGDTTIGGSGLFEMNNSGGTASLSTGSNPYNLTKVGANQWDFQNLATFDSALSNIDIQAGSLLFNGITPGMGDSNATLTVETGASLALGNNQIVFNKHFVLNGDGVNLTINNQGGANDVLAGPVALNGDCVFNIGGTQLIISNTISGSGGLIKQGNSPLILTAPNSYMGNTVINAGSLVLDGTTISTSPTITVSAGATLDTGGSGLILVSGQTLNGNGTVTAGLVAGAGSTVSPAVTPGSSSVGVLTVSGAITLSGTNIMQLDPANETNDVLASSSSISYGGTLVLTNLSSLASGNSFKLFKASSYSGSFGNIIPATPGPGLAWDTSALKTSGTLNVVSSALPKFGGIKVAGGNVILSGSNGVPFNTYYVLTSTNVAASVATWTPIATNTFNSDGSFSFTNSVTPPLTRRFYLLELPGN